MIFEENLSDDDTPDSMEELLFGDDDSEFTKAYVQKVMLGFVIPLEKAYYDIKNAFSNYVLLQGLYNKDMRDLKLDKCIKKVDLLYKKLGYEKDEFAQGPSLSDYRSVRKNIGKGKVFIIINSL